MITYFLEFTIKEIYCRTRS